VGINRLFGLVGIPRRKPNAELRTREYLTDAEVAQLMDATKGNWYGQRDVTMILVAYRHGFRSSELVDLLSLSET
jgi:integrase